MLLELEEKQEDAWRKLLWRVSYAYVHVQAHNDQKLVNPSSIITAANILGPEPQENTDLSEASDLNPLDNANFLLTAATPDVVKILKVGASRPRRPKFVCKGMMIICVTQTPLPYI